MVVTGCLAADVRTLQSPPAQLPPFPPHPLPLPCSLDELRVPACKPFVSPEALAAAAASAAADAEAKRKAATIGSPLSAFTALSPGPSPQRSSLDALRAAQDASSRMSSSVAAPASPSTVDEGMGTSPAAGSAAVQAALQQLTGAGFSFQVRASVCVAALPLRPAVRQPLPSLPAEMNGWQPVKLPTWSTAIQAPAWHCSTLVEHTTHTTHLTTRPPLLPACPCLQEHQVIELVTSLLAQDKVSPEQAASILQQMLPPTALSSLQAHLNTPRASLDDTRCYRCAPWAPIPPGPVALNASSS